MGTAPVDYSIKLAHVVFLYVGLDNGRPSLKPASSYYAAEFDVSGQL